MQSLTGKLTLFYKDLEVLELLKSVLDDAVPCQKIKTELPPISSGDAPGDAKNRFLTLRRVFLLNKEGTYTDTMLLHFLAGWCHFAPETEEEAKLLQEREMVAKQNAKMRKLVQRRKE